MTEPSSQPFTTLRWWTLDLPRSERRAAVRIGLCWLGLGLAQPLMVVIAWLITGTHLIAAGYARYRSSIPAPSGKAVHWFCHARRFVWGVGISIPLVIYTALVFQRDPFLRAWTAQNLIISPHPAHYLAAYGVLLPLVVIGAWDLVKKEPWKGWFPVTWLLLLPVLAYAPYNLQRRLPEGVWVAIVVLAVSGLGSLQKTRVRLARTAVTSFVLVFPTTMLLLLGGLQTAIRPGLPVFRPVEEVELFLYLAANAAPGEVVLSSFETGNAIPAWAPVRVIIGHGPESVGLAQLRPRVAAFFSTETTGQTRERFLQEFDVRFVFWGPAERALGNWRPDTAIFLHEIASRGDYALFKVVSPGP